MRLRSASRVAFRAGCPRSATSHVARMLDAHSDIAMAPRVAGLTTMPDDPDALGPDGMVRPDPARRMATSAGRQGAPPPVPVKQLDAPLAGGHATPSAELVAWALDRCAAGRATPLAIADVVGLAPQLPQLVARFPESRIVHVIRDGHDLAPGAIGSRRASVRRSDGPPRP